MLLNRSLTYFDIPTGIGKDAALAQLNLRGGWTSSEDLTHPSTCRLCNKSGRIETAEHLLVNCPALSKLREEAFENIQNVLSSIRDFARPGDDTIHSEMTSSTLVEEWNSLAPIGKAAVLLGKRRPSWNECQPMCAKIDQITKTVCLSIWDAVQKKRGFLSDSNHDICDDHS